MLELFPFIGQCWNLIQSILIFSENNHCVHQTMLNIIEWIRTLSYLFFSRENDSLFLELMGKESNLALHDPHPAPAVFLSLHLHSQDGTTLPLFLSLSQDLYFSSSSKQDFSQTNQRKQMMPTLSSSKQDFSQTNQRKQMMPNSEKKVLNPFFISCLLVSRWNWSANQEPNFAILPYKTLSSEALFSFSLWKSREDVCNIMMIYPWLADAQNLFINTNPFPAALFWVWVSWILEGWIRK